MTFVQASGCLPPLSVISKNARTLHGLNRQNTFLYLTDIKKNGDFPRQFKRPHVEETDKRHHHDMRKSHSSRKHSRWSRENKETQKEKAGSREGKRLRRDHHSRDEGEDFPRGSKPNSSGYITNRKPSRSLHASHYHRLREEKFLRESKRSKPKKRECSDDGSHDDLFLIKQRKKKPKPSGF